MPIGQPGDASARLLRALASAPVIAAEDTRRLRKMAGLLGVSPAGQLISYFDDSERRRVPALLARLERGQDVLLVTDAGMPGISDPGYRLGAAAAEAGYPVTALPGPSALTAALAVSGLPTDRFCFEGFLPRQAGPRARRISALATEQRTLVFFEAARRLAGTLADLAAGFGADRRAVACRELTKTHEEIRRATLAALSSWAAQGTLGEVTLVVAGAPAGIAAISMAEGAEQVRERVAAGSSRRDAITAVARQAGLSRRELYAAVTANAGAAGPPPALS